MNPRGEFRVGTLNRFTMVPFPECGAKDCDQPALTSVPHGATTKHRCGDHRG